MEGTRKGRDLARATMDEGREAMKIAYKFEM
jgi:hypothetical protein